VLLVLLQLLPGQSEIVYVSSDDQRGLRLALGISNRRDRRIVPALVTGDFDQDNSIETFACLYGLSYALSLSVGHGLGKQFPHGLAGKFFWASSHTGRGGLVHELEDSILIDNRNRFTGTFDQGAVPGFAGTQFRLGLPSSLAFFLQFPIDSL